jgi:hypothetical protein
MSMTLNKFWTILALGTTVAVLSGSLQARDRGINQVGARGGTAGVGAPGVGARDPGINQPGAVGNVGVAGAGVGAPGVGVRDPGINQPGAAGNVGVAGRRVVATSVFVATLPPSCTAVVIDGKTLQQCGGVYYQPSGNQFMVVNVE